ncbi:MAG: 1-acyl-sn-glycerol-3-phosphate acyltransferase [Ferruginibacter sp.]
MDKLVVTVSLADTATQAQPDSLVEFTNIFVEKLHEKIAPFINKINDKVDDDLAMEMYGTVSNHLPIYLNESDYKDIDTLITENKIEETLQQNFKTLTSPAGLALKTMISNDPVGITFLGLKKLQQLQYDENFELYENYVITKDQKNILFFITPKYAPNNTGKNVLLLDGINKIIKELTTTDYKNITASYFGATAVSVGNALQLRKDTMLTQGITVLFLIVFLGIYFRKKRAPFIILIPVLFGALFSIAAIYFIKGGISVIALATGSVVLGIAVNYSLHVFNHYRHTKNIQQVIKDLAIPMTVGSFTTIGGFLCLQFVQSDMLKDLGLFAAFSLIGASICSLIFLPHFIVTKKEQATATIKSLSIIDKIASYKPEYNKYLVLIILVCTIFFSYWATKVGFQSDLGKMNYMSASLKKAETQLNNINKYALQSIYVVTEGKTYNDALVNNEKLLSDIQTLEKNGIVKKYSGVSSLIISDSLQKARIEKWNNYWTSDKKTKLINTLIQKGEKLKFNTSAFNNFKTLINKTFVPANADAIEAIRKNFLDDYITEKPEKTTVVTLVKVAPENKKYVYKTFENNKYVTVLDKQYLSSKLVDIINADFSKIALMTSLLVFFVLLIMYGRIELTLVSFIPMLISWIWILGIMGLFGIQFNIINIIVSTLIFGLGDDYSLFIMDGLLQEYKTGKKNLSSFKSSILLSAITTIAGLGVLIFAKHPALQSIAIIAIVGILSVVIMSQILIPFLFNLLIKNRANKKLFPWTFTNFHKSSFAFSLFISCSVLFVGVGRLFAHLGVKEKGKLLYHTFLSKACWVLMNVMINVKKKIINPLNENFSEPAIIICNHQSSLDIVPLIKLHPKILMFTNNKKWNAPFFGPVIRMADYFPAEDVDKNLDKIADRIKHGYSIVIFPEGTRSEDGTIGRFHKGAFYLAEKLGIDLLPIIIHGTNYALTKKDALLKDGQVTLKFLPRIKISHTNFGNNYAEKSKAVRKYFSEEFENLRKEIEQPKYFREKLIYNYIYKGPFVEWYMRIKTRLENNYEVFHKLVPLQGKILDIGCGYGFMSYMLYFTSNKRIITGIDYDEEKIETANHCFSKTNDINFIAANLLNFTLEKYDAIIIADVLHYLQPYDQKKVIIDCINNLNRNGVLIIRDGDKDDTTKHKKTELTEMFSTKLFKFNKITDKGLFFLSGSMVKELAKENNLLCEEISDSKVTSNTIFVLKNNIDL